MATSRTDDAARIDSVFIIMLRKSMPPAVLAGVATAVVLGLSEGVSAWWAGLFGVAIALAFFGSALLVMAKFVTDHNNPMLFMAVGMSVYFAQILVLLGVLVVARGVEALDMRSAGIAMLVTVLVWQIAQLRAWRRARIPIYDPARPSADSG